MKQETRHIAATHEAGHIMAAALCGRLDLLEWCAIYEDTELAGNTHWSIEKIYPTNYPNGDGSFTDYQNTFMQVCIACGGMCAEKVFFNRQRFPYLMFGGAYNGDWEIIDTTFAAAKLPEKICQHLRKVCEWFVESGIRTNKSLCERLAMALEEKGYLSKQEVTAIIGDSLNPPQKLHRG